MSMAKKNKFERFAQRRRERADERSRREPMVDDNVGTFKIEDVRVMFQRLSLHGLRHR